MLSGWMSSPATDFDTISAVGNHTSKFTSALWSFCSASSSLKKVVTSMSTPSASSASGRTSGLM
jgi:hypothetical protein